MSLTSLYEMIGSHIVLFSACSQNNELQILHSVCLMIGYLSCGGSQVALAWKVVAIAALLCAPFCVASWTSWFRSGHRMKGTCRQGRSGSSSCRDRELWIDRHGKLHCIGSPAI